jgi:hypothetical protein
MPLCRMQPQPVGKPPARAVVAQMLRPEAQERNRLTGRDERVGDDPLVLERLGTSRPR